MRSTQLQSAKAGVGPEMYLEGASNYCAGEVLKNSNEFIANRGFHSKKQSAKSCFFAQLSVLFWFLFVHLIPKWNSRPYTPAP